MSGAHGRSAGIVDAETAAHTTAAGHAMHELLRELLPLPRSITGDGVRQTLAALQRRLPLTLSEVPSGTAVFDWTVPDEWRIEDAYIADMSGRRLVDFRASALHVVGYSTPVDATYSREALEPHLHSLPDQPDLIPYRTAYYAPAWGFCLSHRVRESLGAGPFRVVIRSTLAPGHLTLAEAVIPGATDDEVLLFAHDCHPALANDNLSGVLVATWVGQHLRTRSTRYTYRIVFAPATIGSITWLAHRRDILPRIRHGLVLSLLGGPGRFHYKRTRDGARPIDRAAWHVVRATDPAATCLPFSPWGYDERQFGSPGIDLPMGRLTRTPNGEFPEYHTSADDATLVTAAQLGESWLTVLRILDVLERDATYLNLAPYGEPQLGRRGLYRTTGGHQHIPERQLALLWMLNQSDGRESVLDIAERAALPFAVLADAATDLEAIGLLRRRTDPTERVLSLSAPAPL